MIDNKTKQEILEALEENNGKGDYTWGEWLAIFGIPDTDQNRKAICDIWRRKPQKAKQITEGFEIVKMWGKPDNLQVSLKRKEEDSVDNTLKLLEQIESLSKYSPNVRKLTPQRDKNTIAYELPIQDFHFGREPIDVSVERYINCVTTLTGRVLGNNVEKFIFPVGNDLFNTDNSKYTTTKGTSQFDYDEWTDVFAKGSRAVIDMITTLGAIAPVEVIMVPGNHDLEKNFYLGLILEAWFRNNDNVLVDNIFEPFKFVQYGKCMIMYEHGELKLNDYPLIMATEKPTMFGETVFREVHTGHFHKEMIDEIRGIKVRFIPSLAPNSQWEKKSGYKHLRTAQGFKWHSEQGLIGIEQFHESTL